MARDRASVVKQSRREGYALHPKAHKALVKRTTMPGQAPNARPPRNKASQYSLQLREKQKVKRLYGLLERQFRKLIEQASKSRGQSGTVLLETLERRLDNVVYRAGFAVSRRAARQLVSHGHFMVNGNRVNVPSLSVKVGDAIVARDHAKNTDYFKHMDDVSPAPGTTPGWLKVDRKKFSIAIAGLPTRDDAEPDIKEQLIIEYYSR